MTNNKSASRNEVKSVTTSLELVELLRSKDGATVTELSQQIELSKSSIHSHLQTLENRGYVTGNGGEYQVGLKYLTLGGYAQAKQRLYDLARPEVDGLVDETGLKATVMVEENGRGIYLYQRRGDKTIKTDSHIGTRVYLHCTALGKAILSNLRREEVEAIIDRHGLPQRTENTVSDKQTLFNELNDIRERGYAIDEQERINGVRCVSASIVAENGDVLGSLSLSGSTKNFPEERLEELANSVQEAARVVEINYTYSG